MCPLLKNLYGLKQVVKTSFEHLWDILILDGDKGGCGFKQSTIDPCAFYKDGVILITWVDDCLIFAKDKTYADQLINDIRKTFTITEEEDLSAYLGVEVNMDENTDAVSLTQPYLIKRIVDAIGSSVVDINIKSTPVVYKEILYRDEEGPVRK